MSLKTSNYPKADPVGIIEKEIKSQMAELSELMKEKINNNKNERKKEKQTSKVFGQLNDITKQIMDIKNKMVSKFKEDTNKKPDWAT